MAARAAKEAVVLIVDVSKGMSEHVASSSTGSALSASASGGGGRKKRRRTTRLGEATAVVEEILKSKAQFAPRDEVALVLLGTEDTDNELFEQAGDYEHVTVAAPLDVVTAPLLKNYARELVASPIESDFLNGLVVALDLLKRRTSGRAWRRRLVLLTDGSSAIEGLDDVAPILSKLKEFNITLEVVGVDFAEQGGACDDGAHAREGGRIKAENEKMLHKLVAATHNASTRRRGSGSGDGGGSGAYADCSGPSLLHSPAQAIARIRALECGKKVWGTNTFRNGTFSIGDRFAIPVSLFAAVKKVRMLLVFAIRGGWRGGEAQLLASARKRHGPCCIGNTDLFYSTYPVAYSLISFTDHDTSP